MTKEEAIRTLCAINVPEGHTTIIDKEANIALDMAIQALADASGNNKTEDNNGTDCTE